MDEIDFFTNFLFQYQTVVIKLIKEKNNITKRQDDEKWERRENLSIYRFIEIKGPHLGIVYRMKIFVRE